MKKMGLSFLLILVLLMTGCSQEKKAVTDGTEMFSDRDYEVGYDEEESARIELNGDSAACSSDAGQISGSTVTITDEGTYILSETLTDGMILVNADSSDKLHLILDQVTINSEASAAIYILEADKVFITLADETTNNLSNGGTFTDIDENHIDGAVFSRQDLTFNGSGSLVVTSPAGHGIVCKDDLVFTSGTYVVTSASHGLDANDSIRITNAALTIDSGKDGMHAENSDDTSLGFVCIESGTINISSQGDGISAGSVLQIEEGSFDIISGGGSANASHQTSEAWGGFMGGKPDGGKGEEMQAPPEDTDSDASLQGMEPDSQETEDSTSMKGIKAAGSLIINNGTFVMDTADDAIHSNTSVTVNGGTFEIASGDCFR